MLKSGENGLIGPGSNDYGRSEHNDGEYPVKQKPMKSTENLPRRIRIDQSVPAELAIRNAVDEIEKMGADVRLTNAQVLLEKARELVADYVDENLNK